MAFPRAGRRLTGQAAVEQINEGCSTERSRPVNAPAIGDLFDLFDFDRDSDTHGHHDGSHPDHDAGNGGKGWWPF
ncbi:hypothetical protein F6X37_06410 [Paraburkholderia sp. 31.1]|uniref:hypothetical protein n=1 Tax=Paraburkholderia sp. 31.1 TaxID=2615205 RepID=UPI00165565EB|nr:hypothetical protein [Paraburkholderia sp. 31.1]MBC8721240.1 hypothetical protein [Paraburkholderia sp. 31.1]